MKIVIVSVTRNRKGRPVRVARTIDGETLAIGRGARCEVHLPDPRVALEHATIYRAEGTIRLTAVGTATLLVDGRPDPEATLAPGSRVEIGPYALTVEAPPAGADLAIAIELLRPLPDDLAEIKRRSRMSLAATGLAKRWPAWVLAVTVLALFIAIPVVDVSTPMLRTMTARLSLTPDRSWNPGPLASGHDGFGHDCSKCHELPFVRVRDRTCLGCHKKSRATSPTAEMQAQLFGARAARPAMPITRATRASCKAIRGCAPSCHARSQAALRGHEARQRLRFREGASRSSRLTLWRGPGRDDVVRVAQGDKANLVERSHLKFPHADHLKQSIRGTKGRVTLTCRSCHVPDASGRSFERVVMTEALPRMPHARIRAGRDVAAGSARLGRRGDADHAGVLCQASPSTRSRSTPSTRATSGAASPGRPAAR